MPHKTFSYPCSVSLHDIDAAGVMFFAHYYRHAHDAYEAFMAELGLPLPQLIRDRVLLPLVHSEADYLLPVRYGDSLHIEITLERLGISSYTLRYRMLDKQAHNVAQVKTTHVMLDPVTKRSEEIPGSIREKLAQYLTEADQG